MSDVGDFVERYYDEVGDRLEGMPSVTFVDRPSPRRVIGAARIASLRPLVSSRGAAHGSF